VPSRDAHRPPPPLPHVKHNGNQIKENGVTYTVASAGQDADVIPPALPAKKNPNKKSLPEVAPKGIHIPNGLLPTAEIYSNSEFEPDDDDDDEEDEGTSVDHEDDEDGDEANSDEVIKHASRVLVFRKAEEAISLSVSQIDESVDMCGGLGRTGHAGQYEAAKEELTNESRNFVTASKLFVKSATESEGKVWGSSNLLK
jgi:hypothetical protein